MRYKMKVIINKRLYCYILLYNHILCIVSFVDDENCTFEDIGLSCPFDCRSKLISEIYCKNIVICYENGCTCSSGYTGPNCGVCKYYVTLQCY